MPLDGDVPGDLIPDAKGKNGPSTGRFADSEQHADNARLRDAHSAPTHKTANDEESRQLRTGLHSAPSSKPNAPAPSVAGVVATYVDKGLKIPSGDFIIERSGGPTAADVDEYLTGTLGAKLVKELRSSEWAERVRAIEALQGLVMKANAVATSPADRLALFRACITVLARLLQDKIVPVYLPALQLLTDIYVPSFLGPLPNSEAPRSALSHVAGQLVFRAGSSNVRAREESATAYLHLARCENAGPSAVCPHALRPLANSKSQHAVVGRLELLRTLVHEFGVSASVGLEIHQVISFVVPLCESASEKSRDSAFGVLAAAYGAHPEDTMAALRDMNANVAGALRLRVSPDSEEEGDKSKALAVSGRRLPPLEVHSEGAAPTKGQSLAHAAQQGTPPFADGRARARATLSELGAQSPPKGGVKPTGPRGKKHRAQLQPDNKPAVKSAASLRMEEAENQIPRSQEMPRNEAHDGLREVSKGCRMFDVDDEAYMDSILGGNSS